MWVKIEQQIRRSVLESASCYYKLYVQIETGEIINIFFTAITCECVWTKLIAQ